MKTIRIAITCIILVALLNPSIYPQISDFDSLYHSDPNYRQKIDSEYKNLDIFEDEDVMRVSIESDFKNLMKNKFKDEYQPAILRHSLSDTVVVTRHIEIKPRGHIRRQTCYYPPLMLNFKKQEAVLTQVKEVDKMKMVVKCSKSKINEQYLLSEFYAYKLLNLLTQFSFKVKLIEVTYIDSSGKFKQGTSYAFLIESIDQLADRLEAVPFEYPKLGDQHTNQDQLAIVYLFQYLIGNTDWSIPAGHNMKMVRSKDPADDRPYVIPYDFDFAGIVNANYAVPDASLGIESVRERLYRGVCIDNSVVQKASEHFINQKESILKLYEDADKLDKTTMNNIIQYICEFYRIIENNSTFRNRILEACRK